MRQTIEEIRAAYRREWVLIVDWEDDELGRLVAGKVIAHSPHRRDVDAKLAESKQRRFAIRYTGPVPDDYLAVL